MQLQACAAQLAFHALLFSPCHRAVVGIKGTGLPGAGQVRGPPAAHPGWTFKGNLPCTCPGSAQSSRPGTCAGGRPEPPWQPPWVALGRLLPPPQSSSAATCRASGASQISTANTTQAKSRHGGGKPHKQHSGKLRACRFASLSHPSEVLSPTCSSMMPMKAATPGTVRLSSTFSSSGRLSMAVAAREMAPTCTDKGGVYVCGCGCGGGSAG